MSANKEIRQVRCEDVIRLMGEKSIFLTLTTSDEVTHTEIRSRWQVFRHELLRHLRRCAGKTHYVMNYELHPGYLEKVVSDGHGGETVIHSDGHPHGWHIHAVFNRFIPYSYLRLYADRAGFGRIDFRRITSVGVSDYLTKHALKAYRGLTRKERDTYRGMRLRLVNTSRGLPSLDDYAYTSYHKWVVGAVKRDMLEELRTDSSLLDHRVVSSHAEVCAMLGLAHDWQLLRFYDFARSEWLAKMREESKNKMFHVEQK